MAQILWDYHIEVPQLKEFRLPSGIFWEFDYNLGHVHRPVKVIVKHFLKCFDIFFQFRVCGQLIEQFPDLMSEWSILREKFKEQAECRSILWQIVFRVVLTVDNNFNAGVSDFAGKVGFSEIGILFNITVVD
jgi:hypothetical protein